MMHGEKNIKNPSLVN